ncbi:MAG TPA: hypothetical protein VNQ53_18035 [Nocardioides sp.]|nr:hypothetical protein [Nocardioides sp.]
MGRFAMKSRGPGSDALGELTNEQRAALPPRFEAVGEAQASGADAIEICRHLGGVLAGDGVSLDEALDGLMITSTLVRGRDPDYDELVALSTAWSEATLGYLHRLSCDDPLTGLATQPHVRSRLSELYRARERSPERPLDSHALVVVEIRPGDEGLEQRMTLAQVGRTARTVFAGSETIGGIGLRRVVVIAERDEQLPQRVTLLRTMTEREQARVWIEGLPGSDEAAGALLDELARS